MYISVSSQQTKAHKQWIFVIGHPEGIADLLKSSLEASGQVLPTAVVAPKL